MLKLTEDLLIGIPEVDAQHQELIDRVNELLSMQDRAYFKPEVLKTIDLLSVYVVKHFNDEEAVQAKINYPKIEEHKKEHQNFLEKFSKFKSTYEEEGHSSILALDINSSLIQWVINHVRMEDADIGRFFREQQENKV